MTIITTLEIAVLAITTSSEAEEVELVASGSVNLKGDVFLLSQGGKKILI